MPRGYFFLERSDFFSFDMTVCSSHSLMQYLYLNKQKSHVMSDIYLETLLLRLRVLPAPSILWHLLSRFVCPVSVYLCSKSCLSCQFYSCSHHELVTIKLLFKESNEQLLVSFELVASLRLTFKRFSRLSSRPSVKILIAKLFNTLFFYKHQRVGF